MKIQFDTTNLKDVQTVLELCTILNDIEEQEEIVRLEEEKAEAQAAEKEAEEKAQAQAEKEAQEAKGVSLEDLRAKAKVVANQKGKEALLEVLKGFEAKTVRDIKEEDRETFMSKLIELVGWGDE